MQCNNVDIIVLKPCPILCVGGDEGDLIQQRKCAEDRTDGDFLKVFVLKCCSAYWCELASHYILKRSTLLQLESH